METISPKDGFVAQLLVQDKARVEAGTVILILDSDQEDLRIARIEALENLRTILAKRLSPDVIAPSRQMQQIASDSAGAALPGVAQILQACQDDIKMGLLPQGTDIPIQQIDLSLNQQKSTADLQLQLFDLQLSEAGQINTLAMNQLQSELASANALKAWTHIASLGAGTLRMKVAEGQFVRHGDALFTIS